MRWFFKCISFSYSVHSKYITAWKLNVWNLVPTIFCFREGPSNDGVEVAGYDPADYSLPEKYTYGTGEEYNFK